MASSTPNHSLPYPQGSDDATVHTDLQALAEAVDTELDQIAPGQIVGPTAGQLLVANSSGQVTGVAMSGDGTITPAAALTIGDKKITTAKLDDAAVTTAKLAAGAVTRAATGPWIQTKEATVINADGTGQTTLNWPTAFPSTAYRAVVSVQSNIYLAPVCQIGSKTASGITVNWTVQATATMIILALAIAN